MLLIIFILTLFIFNSSYEIYYRNIIYARIASKRGWNGRGGVEKEGAGKVGGYTGGGRGGEGVVFYIQLPR